MISIENRVVMNYYKIDCNICLSTLYFESFVFATQKEYLFFCFSCQTHTQHKVSKVNIEKYEYIDINEWYIEPL